MVKITVQHHMMLHLKGLCLKLIMHVIFDIHLPGHIKQLCDFKTLAITNSSFIDNQLRTRLSDVLYTVETQQGEGIFIC